MDMQYETRIDELFGLLVQTFGAQDVVREYSEGKRYPFVCDFYVPSRDLFIEFHGGPEHGEYWFDLCSAADIAQEQILIDTDGDQAREAVSTWTERDVEKRATAARNKLNYVVLWDGSPALHDTRRWLAMGAPDACDWQAQAARGS